MVGMGKRLEETEEPEGLNVPSPVARSHSARSAPRGRERGFDTCSFPAEIPQTCLSQAAGGGNCAGKVAQVRQAGGGGAYGWAGVTPVPFVL